MNVTTNHGGQQTEMILGGSLTLVHATALHQHLMEALDLSARLALTLDQVDEMDISFTQLLCATHYAAVLAGKQMTVTGDKDGIYGRVRTAAGLVRTHSCGRTPDARCLWMEGV